MRKMCLSQNKSNDPLGTEAELIGSNAARVVIKVLDSPIDMGEQPGTRGATLRWAVCGAGAGHS